MTGSTGLTVSNGLSTAPYTGPVSGIFTIIGSNSSAPANQSSFILGNPVSLAAYIGGLNSVSLSLANSTSQSGTCVFPVSCGTTGSASGNIQLYYDYSTVAEPTSLSLLGIGALGFVARRRKAANLSVA